MYFTPLACTVPCTRAIACSKNKRGELFKTISMLAQRDGPLRLLGRCNARERSRIRDYELAKSVGTGDLVR